MKYLNSQKSGFTLVEVMVVVSIIGLLAAMAVLSLSRQRTNSRNARRVSDLKTMQTAFDLYENENGSYPSTSSKYSGDPSYFAANKPGGGPYVPDIAPNYVRSLPIDPLYNPTAETYRGYIYYSNGTDYAFIAHGTPEGTWNNTQQFYDPARVPGTHTYPSWKIYTPALKLY